MLARKSSKDNKSFMNHFWWSKLFFLFLNLCVALYTFGLLIFIDSIISWQSVYFLFCMLILNFILAVELRSEFPKFMPWDNKSKFSKSLAIQWAIQWATVALLILLFLSGINMNGVWLDEYNQFIQYFSDGRGDLSRKALTEAQPPMGYAWGSLFHHIFGPSEFGLRISSALAAAFAGGILCSIGLRFRNPPFVAAFFALCFGLVPVVARFSVEARPITYGALYELFYIIFFISYLESRTWMRWLSLTAAGGIYLFALGMQPPIVIFAMTSLAGFCFLTKLDLREFFKVGSSGIASIVIFLPLGLSISNYIERVQPDRQNPIKLSSFLESVANFRFTEFEGMIKLLGMFWPSLVVLSCAGLVFFLSYTFKKNKELERAKVIFWLSFVYYPVVYLVIFYALVNWYNTARYMISFIPLAFVAALAASGEILARVESGRKHLGASLAIVFLVAIPGAYHSLYLGESFKDLNHLDWRIFYNYLEDKRGAAFIFQMNDPSWYPHYFISPEIYHKGDVELVNMRRHFRGSNLTEPGDSLVIYSKKMQDLKGKIYLVQMTQFNDRTFALKEELFDKLDFVKMVSLKDQDDRTHFNVLEVDPGEKGERKLYRLMRHLSESFSVEENEYQFLYFFGMYELMVNQDKSAVKVYLRRLKELPYAHKVKRTIGSLEWALRARSVRRYEN